MERQLRAAAAVFLRPVGGSAARGLCVTEEWGQRQPSLRLTFCRGVRILKGTNPGRWLDGTAVDLGGIF